ncbi:hypothetical protein JJB98_18175 [Bradyrhizobium diazoefficiens]|nr:hypothetical protein [Bradyrhizobium diazoefficiens]QQO21728.1 hypothetical protein JJB98_18175 [Bradyrhizobium diazoefficiens]
METRIRAITRTRSLASKRLAGNRRRFATGQPHKAVDGRDQLTDYHLGNRRNSKLSKRQAESSKSLVFDLQGVKPQADSKTRKQPHAQ